MSNLALDFNFSTILVLQSPQRLKCEVERDKGYENANVTRESKAIRNGKGRASEAHSDL